MRYSFMVPFYVFVHTEPRPTFLGFAGKVLTWSESAAHHPRRSPNFFLGATCAPRPLSPKSHGITSFADPHPLTSIESNSYKKHRGEGSANRSAVGHFRVITKPFRINTYGNSRKCGKQKTYRNTKSFRFHTSKKQGGGGCYG